MFRQGIGEMLGTTDDIEVVGEAGDGEEAVAVEEKPDVVLLDIEMPVMDAEEAMQQILETPSPPRIIVTMHNEPRLVRRLLGRGASAYLVKSALLEELVTAVRNAAATLSDPEKEMVVPRDVLENLEEWADGLSKREVEILLQVACGMSNRQIATSLHLAEATVKRHLANIYVKIEVGSRSEAVRKAMSRGWISAYEIDRSEE